MRLKSITVKGYKNFKEFSFDQFDIETKDVTTVLVGQNGAGKSNLFEILVMIFRNFEYQSKVCPFEFDLIYIINDIEVKLTGTKLGPDSTRDKYKYQSFVKSGDDFARYSKHQFIEAGFLPNNIIAYYSGNTNRLFNLFAHHQNRFVTNVIRNRKPQFRRLFFAREEHLPLILVTQLIYSKKKNKIFNILNLNEAESVRFVLGKPRAFKPEQLDEEERFWGAKGRLNYLFETLESFDTERKITRKTFRKKSTELSVENYSEWQFDFFDSLFIEGRDLKELGEFFESPIEFFKLLEEAIRLKVIKDIQIKIKQDDQESFFDYTHLSEGEKQLLLVLGMIEFTKNENTLYLLDEPDTHLNPRWKYDFISLIKKVIGEKLAKRTQVLFATHEPLIISGLDRDNVLYFKRKSNSEIEMDLIDEDLKGKGIEAILTSELFGLNTTLDKETLNKTIERRQLLLKKEKNELSVADINKLRKLNEQLLNIDFNMPFHDPLYRNYVIALGNLDKYKNLYITEGERTRRQNLANSILKKLMDE